MQATFEAMYILYSNFSLFSIVGNNFSVRLKCTPWTRVAEKAEKIENLLSITNNSKSDRSRGYVLMQTIR